MKTVRCFERCFITFNLVTLKIFYSLKWSKLNSTSALAKNVKLRFFSFYHAYKLRPTWIRLKMLQIQTQRTLIVPFMRKCECEWNTLIRSHTCAQTYVYYMCGEWDLLSLNGTTYISALLFVALPFVRSVCSAFMYCRHRIGVNFMLCMYSCAYGERETSLLPTCWTIIIIEKWNS